MARTARSASPSGGRFSSALSPVLEGLTPETKNAIGLVALCALGLLALLSIFNLAGGFGEWFTRVLGMAFGGVKVLFPFLLFGTAYIFFRHDSFPTKAINLVGLFLVFFSFAAFWHVGIAPDEAWTTALDGGGGGVLGYVFAYPLHITLGFWGAWIVLLAIFLIALLVLFNTTVSRISQMAQEGASLRTYLLAPVRFIFSLKDRLFEEVEVEEGEEDDEEEEDEEEEVEEISVRPSVRPSMPAPQKVQAVAPARPRRMRSKIKLSLDLLDMSSSTPQAMDIDSTKEKIRKALENFGISVEMKDVNVGPTVTQYTFKPAEGTRLSSITALHNDLALALAAHPIRIEAPIPGKSLVGLEVPNEKTAIVSLREVLSSKEFKKRETNLAIALGRDVAGAVRIADMKRMPHLMIAGSTGSGKSICMNAVIMEMLYQNQPDALRFIMVDPKRVELSVYNDIPHLLTPVVTNVKKAINALKWAVGEMDRRYELLSARKKRDLASYNDSTEEKLPYIVVIIDELADIMVSAGPEVETLIVRLAQMARAVGIHLILATQRPSVDVITGLIKANITSRIAFAVASGMDSRTILDQPGAERLVGRGDMLFTTSELSAPVRIQGVFVSDDEIANVTEALKEAAGGPLYEESVTESINSTSGSVGQGSSDDDDDEMLPEAKEIVIEAKKASASFLQRKLRIGYARAARLLDLLEAQGIIGPADGSRPREVYVKSLEELDMLDPSHDEPEEEMAEEEVDNDSSFEEFEEDEDDVEEDELGEDDEEMEEVEDDEDEEDDDRVSGTDRSAISYERL